MDAILSEIPHRAQQNTAELPNGTREQLKELGYLE